MQSENFLSAVSRQVASFCCHFFQQPVFDWFLPGDSLLALVLACLSHYTFKDVSSDILGFTYEAFIERAARNQKGHFLTPPDIVEFMLDRADYAGATIIGKRLLDMACGSGSFLVHAARRLRCEIQSALASQPPIERARTFIAQVQNRLVGLEINPLSCYLAELNLFIQILDDLALLWQNNEKMQIERFSVYHTNSLDMPQSVLQSSFTSTSTNTAEESAIALKGADTVKMQQGAFAYILCNPPYVNRGIVSGAKSYGVYPFYRSVVKGDENFYLLFLRLAAYYVTPGGTICFICPLNLLGDESTRRTRELFQRVEDWQLRSISRFYTRRVLFRGVLQGVCVMRIDRTAARPTDTVEIRGGFSVQEASRTKIQIELSRITANYPASTIWNKPWLIHTAPEVYDLWEFIRQHTHQNLADLLVGKLKVAKGDVRSTWARPLIVAEQGPSTLPLTKGKYITDWGGWSASAYLDPSLTIAPTTKSYASSLWVQRNIQRIATISETETVLLLKEICGLEMQRPIRGSIIQRDQFHAVVADETLLVLYTLRKIYENLAYAVFGLITSAPYNFLFNLFSTNAHANLSELLRLPIPPWSEELEHRLATTTRAAFQTSKGLSEQRSEPGTRLAQAQAPEWRQKVSQQARQQQTLDDQVMAAYNIVNPAWQEMIMRGVAWSK